MIAKRVSTLCFFVAFLSASSACNGKKTNDSGANLASSVRDWSVEKGEREPDHLKLLALAYYSSVENQKIPQNDEDLARFYSSDTPVHPENYVFIWGVDLYKVPDPSHTVLGYVKDVPSKGGRVAFVDGSVRKVSGAEFSKLALAKPSPAK